MNELPKGWVRAEIGDLCQPITKIDPRLYADQSFTYIDIGAIDAGISQVRSPKALLGADAPSRARQVVAEGDTLISTVRVYLRNTALVPEALSGAVASTGFCVLRPAPGIDPKFLFYRTLESGFVNDLSSRQTGSSYPAVRDADVKRMSIGVPPLSEQRRIVDAIEEHFSRIDSGSTALDRTRLRQKRLNVVVLNAAITGRLQYPGLAAGVLPSSWRWVPLKSVLAAGKDSFKRGPFGSALTKATFVSEGYKVYEQYCPINDDCSFDRYFISPERYRELKAFSVQAGDFLVSCSGTLGRITKVPDVFHEGVINQALLRIRTDKQVVLDSYFLAMFRSQYFQRELLANSTGTAMVNVKGVKELKAIQIPLPPIAVQHEIDAQMAPFDALAAKTEQNLVILSYRSNALRRSVLAAAFSGQLVRQDPGDEPAGVLLERIQVERAASSDSKSCKKKVMV